MVAAVLLAFGLLICQSQSQLCGPGGVFPGLLGFENGPFGPSSPTGLQLPIPQSIGAVPSFSPVAPPCGVQVPSCGRQVPSISLPTSYGIQAPISVQAPPCNIQAPVINNIAPGIPNQPCGQCSACGIQAPSNGMIVPSCGVQVPSCGVQVPPCSVQVPSSGVQIPSCGVQVPSCGVQVPSCGVQVPSCSQQAPIVNNVSPVIPMQPCGQCGSFIPNQCSQCTSYSPLAPIVPAIDYVQPALIDNTLANSLANALQLLIVSNLLESTLTPCSNSYSPVYESAPYCGNVIDITPDYYPCSQISCEPVYETCYQDPISYSPCVEISSIPYDNCLVNNYANNYGCADNSVLINPFVNGFGCSDPVLVNPFSGGFGCSDNSVLVKPFANNNCGCLNSLFSPMAAEVLFPAEIPAQLTCNFGYMTSNVPCVSVNVEALPFDTCSCKDGLYY